jgi:hypothetical protein
METKTNVLDLNAYGVSELSRTEMFNLNGGNLGNLVGRITGHIVNAATWIWENCTISVSVTIGTSPGGGVCISCPIN